MAIKFLQEKERQEIMIYVVAFIATLVGLVYFVGLDFNFEKPEVVLEGRENFFEIKTTLEQIEATHDLAKFRTFTLIPLFDGVPGRTNLFSLDGIEAVGVANEGFVEMEERGAVLFELPEEETEEMIAE